MLQSTPLRGPTSSSAYFRPGIGFDTICHISAWADHFPGQLHHRSTILSVLGPNHALTVLFLGTHKQLPSGSPIMGVLWPASRLTSKFRQNPKPVSSQKASY
ncbi:hypothetical protein ACFX2I_025407 [Malus domestica]